MSQTSVNEAQVLQEGLAGVASDFSADRQSFHVHWGKAMMWIFLLSDTFIFSSFLIGYMTNQKRTKNERKQKYPHHGFTPVNME